MLLPLITLTTMVISLESVSPCRASPTEGLFPQVKKPWHLHWPPPPPLHPNSSLWLHPLFEEVPLIVIVKNITCSHSFSLLVISSLACYSVCHCAANTYRHFCSEQRTIVLPSVFISNSEAKTYNLSLYSSILDSRSNVLYEATVQNVTFYFEGIFIHICFTV
jgi:hypothetical protein